MHTIARFDIKPGRINSILQLPYQAYIFTALVMHGYMQPHVYTAHPEVKGGFVTRPDGELPAALVLYCIIYCCFAGSVYEISVVMADR